MTSPEVKLLPVFVFALGCNASNEESPDVQTEADHDAGPADTDADGNGPYGDPSSSGRCFEIFGPPGISHPAPRRHDLGVVALGDRRDVSIGLYNFCGDPEARLLALEWPESLNPAGHGDFAVSGLPVGYLFPPSISVVLHVGFVPSVAGFQHAVLRMSVSHGYYDFAFAAEAVTPGAAPVRLDATCFEAGHVEHVGPTTPLYSRHFAIDVSPQCDYAFGLEHWVIESASITRGGETFFYSGPEASVPFLVANFRNSFSTVRGLLIDGLVFFAATAGTFTGELTLHTNDAVGNYTIELLATAE